MPQTPASSSTTPKPKPNDPRWAAVLARDARADGSFVYSVKTTGVYCRPSCPSRAAKPANVAFHASTAEAEQAGFRACKRCDPSGPTLAERRARVVAELCTMLDDPEQSPGLEALARRAGASVFHTGRMFKAVTGLTPKAYAAARRAERMRAQLDSSPTITRAIHASGFGSSARFYEQSTRLLGMTPSDYRAAGREHELRFAVGPCSLGSVLVAASEVGIAAIFLGDDPEALVHDLERRFAAATLIGGDAAFEAIVARVVAHIEAPRLGLDLPLDVRGTVFQRRVWQALQAIPVGETSTYAAIAERLGAAKAVRAVAGACAANPIAVVIPCHRVVRRDGALAGYRWGIERKRSLLERESPP